MLDNYVTIANAILRRQRDMKTRRDNNQHVKSLVTRILEASHKNIQCCFCMAGAKLSFK